VFLLHCPRCWGTTLLTDDPDGSRCRHCGWHGRPPLNHIVRDPEAVRQFVAKDLGPVAALLRTLGMGQTIIALVFCFFLVCGGGASFFGFTPQLAMAGAIGVVLLVGGVLICAGDVAIRLGRWRLIAVVGAIFALTSPLLIGLPLGVWALQRLNRPEVRAAFAPSVGRSES